MERCTNPNIHRSVKPSKKEWVMLTSTSSAVCPKKGRVKNLITSRAETD